MKITIDEIKRRLSDVQELLGKGLTPGAGQLISELLSDLNWHSGIAQHDGNVKEAARRTPITPQKNSEAPARGPEISPLSQVRGEIHYNGAETHMHEVLKEE